MGKVKKNRQLFRRRKGHSFYYTGTEKHKLLVEKNLILLQEIC